MNESQSSEPTGWWTPGRRSVALLFTAFLLYSPTAFFGFVNWDDPAYVIENEAIADPQGLVEIWTSREMPPGATNWPLVFTTYWVEYQFAGLDPRIFHLTNALLHALGACLAFWMLRELGADLRTCTFAGFVFAVHPIQVESVAWITERKNVLSGVFFFASLAEYFRYRRLGGGVRYALSVVFFALALASKSSVVALPLLMICADRFVFDRRWTLGAFKRAALPVLLSVLSALMTLQADVVSSRNIPWEQRPFVVPTTYWFYLGKLLNPSTLIIVYPRWHVDTSNVWWWISAASALLVIGILIRYRNKIDGIAAWGICLYVLMLAPVSGIKPFGYMRYTFVADHFVYLSCLGVFIVAGRLMGLLDRPGLERTKRLLNVAIVVAVVSLSLKTMTQMIVWRDSEILWETTTELSPASAHDVRATSAFNKDDFQKAATHLREVVLHRPDDIYALTSLGQCLFRSTDRAEGMQLMKRAVRLDPTDFDALRNLAKAYVELGDFENAITYFERALRQSASSELVFELGMAHLAQGQLTQAEEYLNQILNAYPSHAHGNLGMAQVLIARGHLSAARSRLETLTKQFPKFDASWRLLAELHFQAGDRDKALATLDAGIDAVEESDDLKWYKVHLLCDTMMSQDRHQEALTLCTQLLQEDEKLSARELEIAAQALALNDQYEKAVHFLERALVIAPAKQKQRLRQLLQQFQQREKSQASQGSDTE